MAKILFVEDDSKLAELVVDILELEEFEHHKVEWVSAGEEGYERLRLYVYDLVVLDVQLPGMSGFEILKKHRQSGGSTPVLMLTGKHSR